MPSRPAGASEPTPAVRIVGLEPVVADDGTTERPICHRCREELLDRLESVLEDVAQDLGMAALAKMLARLFPESCERERPTPTSALPQSREKVAVMTARVANGEDVHHPDDTFSDPCRALTWVRTRNGRDVRGDVVEARPEPNERIVTVADRPLDGAQNCKCDSSQSEAKLRAKERKRAENRRAKLRAAGDAGAGPA